MRATIAGPVAVWLLVGAICVHAQTSGQAAQPAVIDTARDLFAKLTPEEQQSYQAASKDFNAQRYAEALTVYKALLATHAGDSFLSKMVGESAADTGDRKFALEVIQPIEKQNPDDWQVVGLMTRIYTETGDKVRRDAGMAHMTELYNKCLTPKGQTQKGSDGLASLGCCAGMGASSGCILHLLKL